jgi:hypothetical protein
MSETYFVFGEVIAGAFPGSLSIPEAKKTWDALIPRREFTIIEARRHKSGDRYAEILVVDCKNDSVPTRNPVGIEYLERLGLMFYSQPDIIPEVRALRVGFPATLHQYYVPKGEPASLCLYPCIIPNKLLRLYWKGGGSHGPVSFPDNEGYSYAT